MRLNDIASLKSLKKTPWLYLLLALLGWACISTALSDDPWNQFRGSFYRLDGLASYFIYAGVFVCALCVRKERYRTRILRLFVGAADVLGVIMILQAAHVWQMDQIFASPWASVFNQFNHFGYMLCMASLCAASMFLREASTGWKAFQVLSFGFLVFTLLLNDTFGCYLAVLLGLVVISVFWFAGNGRMLAARNRGGLSLVTATEGDSVASGDESEKVIDSSSNSNSELSELAVKKSGMPRGKFKILLVPIAVFIALSLGSYLGVYEPLQQGNLGNNLLQLTKDVDVIYADGAEAKSAGTGRMNLWVEAVKMIPERPLFGYGPEGLQGEYKLKVGNDRPHCELIQYAVFLGIPALIMYLAALVILFVMQWRGLKRLSPTTLVAAGIVVGYFASSLFGNTMYYTAPYFWMALGLAALPPAGAAALPIGLGADGVAFADVSRVRRIVLCALGIFISGIIVIVSFMM